MFSFVTTLSNHQSLITAGVIVILFFIVIYGIVRRFGPGKFKTKRFTSRWQEIEQMCHKNDTWPLAVINADKLLDDALKARRFKGKTMGERLVSAQRSLSDNESVWFGHKLRNKIVHEDVLKLPKRDVHQAVRGFHDALKDLGVL